MKYSHSWKIAAGVAGWLALEATLTAGDVSSTNNPYSTIAARNIFGLHAPPTATPDQPPEPDAIITPNGIVSIFGPARVLFKVREKAYVLGEGQRQDDIEVLKIDETKQIITFNNHGVIQHIPLAAVRNSDNNEHLFIGNHLRMRWQSPQT